MLEKMLNLALAFFNVGAVKCNGYYRLKLHETKPKAPESPIYLNLRTPENPKPGPLTPKIVDDIAQIFYDFMVSDGIKWDFLIPIPNAAVPFVRALAKLIPGGEDKILYLTKEVESETRRIGRLTDESRAKIKPGDIGLLFDDLVTGADSKLEAAHALENEGMKVHDIIVLVDREQGGRDELEKEGYILHSMITLSKLLELYHDRGLINDEKFQEICLYLKNS
jgi:uridine monophosphate synthetase